MRVAKSALGVAVLCGGLLFGGAAAFGQTRSGGAIQVWGTPANNGGRGGAFILFTGAVADSGKGTPANASGKPVKKGAFNLVVLKKGTILLDPTQLRAGINNTSPTPFDSTTCSGVYAATAPVPIVSGTKAYAGISGTANVTLTMAAVLQLTNGKCDMNNPNTIAQYGSIVGSGTVSFR